jgi:uncharacterized protein (TIGR00369 family)
LLAPGVSVAPTASRLERSASDRSGGGKMYRSVMTSDSRTDGWQTVADGPFEGWLTWVGDPYEDMVGPFYFRTEDDGRTGGAFVPEAKHANGGGIVHGGALMSFADATIGAFLYIGLNGQFAVTVTLNCEFVGAGVVGSPIYATGRIVRDTKSLAFVHGQMEQHEQPILTFSSVMKKITPR